jgi:hypothetical protein
MQMKTRYTRAGIIPVVKHENKLAVVLFQQPYNNVYSDGGGGRDRHELDPKVTACRELQEESKNLFRINPEILTIGGRYNYFTRKGRKKESFVYFVGVDNNIYTEWYKHNHQIIKGKSNLQCWFETKNANVFYLNDILFGNDSKDVPAKTIDGKIEKISHRTARFIKNGLIGNEDNITFTKLIECDHFQSEDFLNGTKSYMC